MPLIWTIPLISIPGVRLRMSHVLSLTLPRDRVAGDTKSQTERVMNGYGVSKLMVSTLQTVGGSWALSFIRGNGSVEDLLSCLMHHFWNHWQKSSSQHVLGCFWLGRLLYFCFRLAFQTVFSICFLRFRQFCIFFYFACQVKPSTTCGPW